MRDLMWLRTLPIKAWWMILSRVRRLSQSLMRKPKKSWSSSEVWSNILQSLDLFFKWMLIEGEIKQLALQKVIIFYFMLPQADSTQLLACNSIANLRKFTRVLDQEQQKATNRIRLFKQTSQKMLSAKVRARQNLQKYEQAIKTPRQLPIQMPCRARVIQSQGSIRSRGSLRSASIIGLAKNNEASQLAQSRRVQKLKNQFQISKIREKEKRKNLKSAKLIRNTHEQTKVAKQNFFQWKIEAVRAENKLRLQKEQKQYLKKVAKLERLKKAQLDALLQWKQVKKELSEGEQMNTLI